VGTAKCNLPDVFQGNTGIRREPNRGLLRISPTLSEVVTGSQEGAPIALRRRPYAMSPASGIKGHRVNIVTVKIGATHIPPGSLRVGANDERSLRGSHQQKKVPFAHMRVAHAVQNRRS